MRCLEDPTARAFRRMVEHLLRKNGSETVGVHECACWTGDSTIEQCRGSELFSSRIPDPKFFHPGSASNNASILTQKIVFLSSRKYDPGGSSRIRIPIFYPSRIKGSKRHRIQDSGSATLQSMPINVWEGNSEAHTRTVGAPETEEFTVVSWYFTVEAIVQMVGQLRPFR